VLVNQTTEIRVILIRVHVPGNVGQSARCGEGMMGLGRVTSCRKGPTATEGERYDTSWVVAWYVDRTSLLRTLALVSGTVRIRLLDMSSVENKVAWQHTCTDGDVRA